VENVKGMRIRMEMERHYRTSSEIERIKIEEVVTGREKEVEVKQGYEVVASRWWWEKREDNSANRENVTLNVNNRNSERLGFLAQTRMISVTHLGVFYPTITKEALKFIGFLSSHPMSPRDRREKTLLSTT